MKSNKILALTFVTSLSILIPLSPSRSEAKTPRISRQAILEWMQISGEAINIGGTLLEASSSSINQAEVKRNYRHPRTRIVLFSYVANCRDQQNITRFWRHKDNGDAVDLIQQVYPKDQQSRRRAVLGLINSACNP